MIQLKHLAPLAAMLAGPLVTAGSPIPAPAANSSSSTDTGMPRGPNAMGCDGGFGGFQAIGWNNNKPVKSRTYYPNAHYLPKIIELDSDQEYLQARFDFNEHGGNEGCKYKFAIATTPGHTMDVIPGYTTPTFPKSLHTGFVGSMGVAIANTTTAGMPFILGDGNYTVHFVEFDATKGKDDMIVRIDASMPVIRKTPKA